MSAQATDHFGIKSWDEKQYRKLGGLRKTTRAAASERLHLAAEMHGG